MSKIHVITPLEWASIKQLAAELKVSPEIIAKLISVETAGTFSTTIKNPYSGAAGISQWTNTTARWLGFKSAADLIQKNPTFDSQTKMMGRYFRKWAPINNDYEFALANFMPAHRHKPPNTTLVSLSPLAAKQNPGIRTLGDYYEAVRKRKIDTTYLTRNGGGTFPAVLLIAGIATAFFLLVGSCSVEHEEKITTRYIPLDIFKTQK